jgi:hypothetical protein
MWQIVAPGAIEASWVDPRVSRLQESERIGRVRARMRESSFNFEILYLKWRLRHCD